MPSKDREGPLFLFSAYSGKWHYHNYYLPIVESSFITRFTEKRPLRADPGNFMFGAKPGDLGIICLALIRLN
jgi:hypothetical protein